MEKHYDAWHHPIVGLFEMIKYYEGDKRSQRVVRQNPSHRYISVPFLRIEINPLDLGGITLKKVYPGGQESIYSYVSKNALDALRRLYVSPRGGWTVSREGSRIIFVKRGCAVKCPGGADLYHTAPAGR
jgi:hypothetical protein